MFGVYDTVRGACSQQAICMAGAALQGDASLHMRGSLKRGVCRVQGLLAWQRVELFCTTSAGAQHHIPHPMRCSLP